MSVTIRRVKQLGVLIGLLSICVSSEVLASSVLPSAQDIHVETGEKTTVMIEIINSGSVNQVYEFGLIDSDFGENRSEVFFTEIQEENFWVQLRSTQAALAPGEVYELEVELDAQKVNEGLHTFGVQVTEVSNDSDSITIAKGFISHVFVTVGNKNEQGFMIESFKKVTESGKIFPVSFVTTIANTGEGVLKPIGTVEIKNIFGIVVDVLDFNPQENRILPGQSYTYVQEWSPEKNSIFSGYYRAKLLVVPWEDGELFKDTLVIAIFPWKLIILLGIFISLFIGFIIYRKRLTAQL